MLIYGFHSVGARLRRDPASVTELYVDAHRDDGRTRDLVALAASAGVVARAVPASRLDTLCPEGRHQGVVAIARSPEAVMDLDALLDGLQVPPLLLLLDGVTDPRNLGACLRVADGAGAHAVIAPKDRACTLTDVAVRTSAGAAESVPYVMVTNLARTIVELQERDIRVIGTADQSEVSLWELDLTPATAWVLGAEGSGLRRLVRDRCDEVVSIPMAGQVESLNVAVASGIVLYESFRRRSAAGRVN
jgi:23S rRNA (guanosine2251-2'-O)-methyltransferase